METAPNHLKTAVVIIGAGPTGLSLAVQLVRYQIPFIILDRNSETTQLSKAVVVQARTLEIFREINLAEKAIAEGAITTAVKLFYKGRKKAAIDLAGLGNGLSPYPYALSLEQSKTEKLLAGYLLQNEKTIYRNCEFKRYEENENGLTVYYSDADGQEQIIDAGYIVGCDGAHSLVRHQMGASFEGDTVPKLFYVADVQLTSPVINTPELYAFLIEKGFVLFFPMEGSGHYRIVGILPDVTNMDEKIAFDVVEKLIKDQLAVPVKFTSLIWFSTYKVHSRMANTFQKGRCFIAGDAAHIHTPAGGQGMNTGIQDAYNLAWKLAHTIRYGMNASVLESYHSERQENATHLLRTTDRMFDIMAGTSLVRNFLRLNILPLVARFVSHNSILSRRIFPLLSQTGIAYPNSWLTVESKIGKIKAGDRMPYFTLGNGKNIFDVLIEPVFKILYFGNQTNKQVEQLQAGKFPVASFFFNEIPKDLFGTSAEFYILLRPDNHISYIGKDVANCIQLFKKMNVL